MERSSTLKPRSRSPKRVEQAASSKRKRSRSPHHARRHAKPHHSSAPVELPFRAQPLSRNDLAKFRPMFGLYLDIQKQLDIDDLDEEEVKGRWKSFVGKWNRGDGSLAEGWYDPETFAKAKASQPTPQKKSLDKPRPDTAPANSASDEDEDDYGPRLPGGTGAHRGSDYRKTAGPTIPRASDLRLHHETVAEEAAAAHSTAHTEHRAERKAERQLQAARLDELVPRAEAGSRERALEKRRELAASNRSFAAAKTETGGDVVDLPDSEVMGAEDSLSDLKRMKQHDERKKNEREIRREEIFRARKAEREERMLAMKGKEDRTMEMLKQIANARFGGGGSSRDGDGDGSGSGGRGPAGS